MQSKWQCNDDLHHAWLITLWRIWHANQWKMMCSPLKNDSNPFSTIWQEKSLTDLQVRAKAKNYLARSSLCCHFAVPEGIDQSIDFFFLMLKSSYSSGFPFVFQKSPWIYRCSLCSCWIVLWHQMLLNEHCQFCNILIMLIESCGSIDSIFQ